MLGQWLAHRARLWRKYAVPVPEELHMTEYALGRGRISRSVPEAFVRDDGTVLWKDLGGAIARESLSVMGSIEGLRVGAVHRQATRSTWAISRSDVYAQLLSDFEGELARSSSLAMVFVDGDGAESGYRHAHRALPHATRRVIEDPIHTDSRTSQVMQMADHVAWCANAAVARIPKQAFAHDWYRDYLAPRDPERRPREI